MNIEKNQVQQFYQNYSEEDHVVWELLSHRQKELDEKKICTKYFDGVSKLQFDIKKIVKINEVSERLEELSGWTLVPVSGLIPTKDFFYMLTMKKYPVTISIRKINELDFSEQPDIFHDVIGHLPLLTNEKFTEFLTAYSTIALKYVNNDRAIDFLGRLYWYTYEMGLIREGGELKPYGGAIITSAFEIKNMQDTSIPKYDFDIDHIFRTSYNPFRLQNEYFVIESFDDLFDSLHNLESKLIEHLLISNNDFTLGTIR
jgi:phenylalanine-4-hydroxylase